jgi:polysaccharide deacetylase 2 family uncharacterized protein YibQ
LLGTASAAPVEPEQKPRVVIIIDDIGHNLGSGKRAVALAGAVNYAILPHTANAAVLAQLASASGKEVILHMPMTSQLEKSPGPGALTPGMDRTTFLQALRAAISSVPEIKGLSNHMGSELTSMHQPMQWLMSELLNQKLYFVDSRTTNKTLGASTAAEYGVPYLKRLVFLDNVRTDAAISQEYERLLDLAELHGVAAAIGHPHAETLAFLEQNLPELEARGYSLALISEVLSKTTAAATIQAAL